MSSIINRVCNSSHYLARFSAVYKLQRPSYDNYGKYSRFLSTGVATKDTKPAAELPEESVKDAEIIKRIKAIYEDDIKDGGVVPVYKYALLHSQKIAIKDDKDEFTYGRIYAGAKKLSIQISNLCGSGSNARVVFLCPNNALYTLVQWSCWFSGQIAVPLSPLQPSNILEYYIKDCESNLLVTTPEHEITMKAIAEKFDLPLIVIDHSFIPDVQSTVGILDPKKEFLVQLNERLVIEGTLSANFYAKSNAMIMYTSGTTGKPKGTLISFKNLASQINCLSQAWQMNNTDCLLHVLPLNHVHGCINALACPLSNGSKIIMLPKHDSHAIWSHLLNINMPSKDKVSVFMAVPTIYNLLIDEYDKMFSKNARMVEYIKTHCERKIRLMISGSAALPLQTYNKWYDISGHRLLERYGMTEIGMALSNPYIQDKVRTRLPGTVGMPLPDVEVKIVNNDKTLLEMKGAYDKGVWQSGDLPVFENQNVPKEPITGELFVKGPHVFTEYYKKPEATAKAFKEGWFHTGDEVSFDGTSFKIMGRSSVDIIKTGGYKLSALEIETYLRDHPQIVDVAVVGVPDITWGQKVAALIVTRDKKELEVIELTKWCNEKMASYAKPTIFKYVELIPRNAMGKVNKIDILKEYFPDSLEPKKENTTNDQAENVAQSK